MGFPYHFPGFLMFCHEVGRSKEEEDEITSLSPMVADPGLGERKDY